LELKSTDVIEAVVDVDEVVTREINCLNTGSVV
jgi:hypothetical protein